MAQVKFLSAVDEDEHVHPDARAMLQVPKTNYLWASDVGILGSLLDASNVDEFHRRLSGRCSTTSMKFTENGSSKRIVSAN